MKSMGLFLWLLLVSGVVEQHAEFKKPERAELSYIGRRHALTLSLVPGVWTRTSEPPNPSIEVMFMHRDGDVAAGVISERSQLSMESLKRLVKHNLQSNSRGPVRILSELQCVVNGKEMSRLTYTVQSQAGSSLTLLYELYAGPEGCFQVFAGAPSNAFDDVKSDLEDFLSGFEITVPPKSKPRQ